MGICKSSVATNALVISKFYVRLIFLLTFPNRVHIYAGADPGFQVRGGALKKIALSGAKILGVFRVKNHDFMPINVIFSNFRGARIGCTPLPPGSAPVYV